MNCFASELDDVEIEIKFKTDAEGLQNVLQSPLFLTVAAVPAKELRSTYFDTAEGDLWSQGIVLRSRSIADKNWVLTLKASTGSGPFRRTEIEVPSTQLKPDIALFNAKTAQDLYGIIGDKPLEIQFETQVKRQAAVVHEAGSQIEVAFDDGWILASEARLAISEVEMELKSGKESDLYGFALKALRELPLRLDFVNKSERGMRLRGLATVVPVKTQEINLLANATFDEAVATILNHTMEHFTGNWEALRTSDAPEAIHQLRVALRRMKSALAMFNHVAPCEDFQDLSDDIKRISTGFGPARECDVFHERIIHGPLAPKDKPVGSEALLKVIEDRRIAVYIQARSMLEDRETTVFVLKLQRLLAQQSWKVKKAKRPRKFVRAILRRLYNHVLKRGKELSGIDERARHRLRISFKKLRYGVDFFGASLGKPRKTKQFIRHIVEMQDLLGFQSDAVSARNFLKALVPAVEESAKISGYIRGWNDRSALSVENKLIAAWKAFKRAEVFWK